MHQCSKYLLIRFIQVFRLKFYTNLSVTIRKFLCNKVYTQALSLPSIAPCGLSSRIATRLSGLSSLDTLRSTSVLTLCCSWWETTNNRQLLRVLYDAHSEHLMWRAVVIWRVISEIWYSSNCSWSLRLIQFRLVTERRDSSGGTATGYGLDGQGFDSQHG